MFSYVRQNSVIQLAFFVLSISLLIFIKPTIMAINPFYVMPVLLIFIAFVSNLQVSNYYFFFMVTLCLFGWMILCDEYFFEIRNFDTVSNFIVKDAIKNSILERNVFYSGGFMGIYFSQFALQYKVFAVFAPSHIESLDHYLYLIRLITGFLFALTLSLFVLSVKKNFGKFSSFVLIIGVMFSPWLLKYSMHLYWVIFLCFLPFAITWSIYDDIRRKKNYKIFYALITILVFIKCLCGYEFITNIILSPIIPLIYYEIKEKTNIRTIALRSVSLFICGVIGFVSAFSLHLLQSVLLFRSFEKGLQVIMDRASARTFGDMNHAQTSISSDLGIFYQYLIKPISLGINENGVNNLSIIMIFLISISVFYIIKRNHLNRTIIAFSIAAILSLLVTLSWAIFGVGHMRYHLHINDIIFYLVFLIMAFSFIPYLLLHLFPTNIKDDLAHSITVKPFAKYQNIFVIVIGIVTIVFIVSSVRNDFKRYTINYNPSLSNLTSHNIIDEYWDNGIKKEGAAVLLRYKENLYAQLKSADELQFSKSGTRNITDVVISSDVVSDNWIIVYVDGEKLFPREDGYPNKINVISNNRSTTTPQNFTDENWTNGIHTKQAAFFMKNNLVNQKLDLKKGDDIKFNKSGIRNIVDITVSDLWINVYVEGEKLDPKGDGYPNQILISK